MPFLRYCRFSINVLEVSSAIPRHVGPTCLHHRVSFDMVKCRVNKLLCGCLTIQQLVPLMNCTPIKIHVLLIQVRREFMDTSVAEVLQSGSFDSSKAWNETILKGSDPNRVVSPLMPSLQCYEDIQNYFPGGLTFWMLIL